MRSRILDACEALANLIAMCSHVRELFTDEDIEADEQDALETYYDYLLAQRRTLQKQIEDEIDKTDGHYHCILKHALAYYIYSSELEDADKNKFKGMSKKGSETLNYALSLMAKEEVILCSRCLADKVLDTKKE